MLEKRGRTAYSLAKETGIRYASIWQMSKGDTARLHIETLDRICEALEVDPDELREVRDPAADAEGVA